MRMHFLSGGRLQMRKRAYYPDAERSEIFELPVSCALIRHPQANVLFDTGCSPRAAAETDAYWGHLAKVMTPVHAPDAIVLDQLPKAGLVAEDIDLVVCSHLHTDHCGCNSFFKRATVVCSAAELKAAPADTSGAYIAEDWEAARSFDTFSGHKDLFGDGRVSLIEAPGHTAGMVVGHVVLDTQAFVLASDAAPVRATLEQRYAPKGTWNDELFLKALDEIARLEREGAQVIFGHDEAQWRELRTGAAYYD